MAKKSTKPTPTREEILSYDNVPYAVAAKYIGWSDATLRNALQQGRTPFGCAAKNLETGTWAYNVSPGLLVKYKEGELQAWNVQDVLNLAADGIRQVLDAQLEAAAAVMDSINMVGKKTKPSRWAGVPPVSAAGRRE